MPPVDIKNWDGWLWYGDILRCLEVLDRGGSLELGTQSVLILRALLRHKLLDVNLSENVSYARLAHMVKKNIHLNVQVNYAVRDFILITVSRENAYAAIVGPRSIKQCVCRWIIKVHNQEERYYLLNLISNFEIPGSKWLLTVRLRRVPWAYSWINDHNDSSLQLTLGLTHWHILGREKEPVRRLLNDSEALVQVVDALGLDEFTIENGVMVNWVVAPEGANSVSHS